MDAFESIKQCGSDILFSLYEFDAPVSPIQNHKSTTGLDGAQIIEHVLHSARIKNAVTEIAAKEAKTVEDVFAEVKAMLEDMGHTFTLKSIRLVAYLLRKVFRNIYSGIKVNKEGINEVREISKECPVVFVPTHRSYTDFLLVSFVCFIFQLPLPIIAAAQDFKNMKLIGGLLRSCGAFYMKRSFRSDKLYWTVFSEYVQCLLLNSGQTMEFFLEGTRSRSGKTLHPKQGFLSILTDLYFTSRVPDIMFCPITISYDRVLEESLMARELLGVPKPKESLKGLFHARSVLSDDYGYAYLYFGKPISLREFSNGLVNRVERSCIPRSIRSEATSDEMIVVKKLARHILEKLQDHLVILPNMIVASILLQNPTGIRLEILTEKYKSVLEWCKECDVPVARNDADETNAEITASLKLLKSSLIITENNWISILETEQIPGEFKSRVYSLLSKGGNSNENSEKVKKIADSFGVNSGAVTCDRGDARDTRLNELPELLIEEKNYLVNLTCVHLQLAHQRNQLLHWFFVPAMATLGSCGQRVSEDELYNTAKFLGNLVCGEIAKEGFPSKQEFVSVLEKFKQLDIFERSEDGFYTRKHSECSHFVSGLWRPILVAYWVVASYILDSCNEKEEYPANTLIQNCQETALQQFLKGLLQYLEIQSLELLRNGLKSLKRLEMIKQITKESEQLILVSNSPALFNVTMKLGEVLGLQYHHKPVLSSKL